MKNIKQKLASILAVMLLGATAIAIIPSGNSVEMNFDTSGSEAILTEYYGSDVKVNVPETVGGKDVTTISATAFADDSHVTMIYLPITVTTVEKDVFLNCADDLAVILELSDPLADVPKDVGNWGLGEYTAEIRHFTSTGRTDLFIQKGEIVEEDEVITCSNIKAGSIYQLLTEAGINRVNYSTITFVQEADMPRSNVPSTAYDISEYQTGCVMLWAEGTDIIIWFMNDELIMHEDMSRYFSSYHTNYSNRDALKNITQITGIEHLNTERATDMSQMFYYSGALTSLDLSTFDTSNVTNMTSMFHYAYKLTSIDLSSFNTSKVTSMLTMFNQCGGLTQLDVSSFDTSNVVNMGNMFYWCTSLTELDVTNFNTSKVTNMSYMFGGCRSLTELNVSKFDTSNVTNMAQMFIMMQGINALDVTKFNTSKVTNMSYMFSSLSSVTSLDLRNLDISSVTNMDYMFFNSTSLNTIYVKDAATEAWMRATYSFPSQAINFIY